MAPSRLFLKNLPRTTTRDDVFRYLERFGKLTELKIIESESSTYGFAQFSSEEDAKYVLETFHGRLFLGHRTVIEPARPLRKDMLPSTEPHYSRSSDSPLARSPCYSARPKYRRYPVLVENIPPHICWQELKDFGRLSSRPVAYCEVDRKKNGHGFIEYLSLEDADDAIRTLNGQKLGGRPVLLARPKPYRQRSRSRSPTRHTSPHTRFPFESYDPHRGRCAFPTSASRYSLQSSPVRVPLRQRYPSPVPAAPALPAVHHHDLRSFSRIVDSYRSALCSETAALERIPMLQTASSVDSSESVPQPAAEHTSPDYYNFDQHLRLLNHDGLEYLPGYFS
ncbi:hypothetical protein B0H15DRAFT_103455 [Mycena belliarum]|uniref:RRM domain-containing protein n=1 Tax=Mycena belliarum TaxID=1033014 RepID=A0AAD6XXK7_9AGAR|nr:hypothetical protein B0H15DRAFT_103455 [Mycena belliae]